MFSIHIKKIVDKHGAFCSLCHI